MTFEELDSKRAELGSDKLAALREECRQRQSGHDWQKTQSGIDPQRFCGHCFYRPTVDPPDISN
jgi:hypothetical protein